MVTNAELNRLDEPTRAGLRMFVAVSKYPPLAKEHVERILDWRHWRENPRPSSAPPPAELREMLWTQLRKRNQSMSRAAEAVGLHRQTLQRIVTGSMLPTYTTLIKATSACGIDVTVTPPGSSLPEALPGGNDPPDPATLQARAPSLEELQAMVRARVGFIGRKTGARRMAMLRNLPRHALEHLFAGRTPEYGTLRTILAAFEIELVIRPPGDPLPESLRLTRFAADKPDLPIVQLREHDSTTAIAGSRIRAAAPPADIGETERAFYVIWPHDAETGTGLQEGDYCLVLPDAGQQTHGLVWIEAGTRTVGRKVPQHYETMKGSTGAPPVRALVWKMGETGSEPRILSIPISEIHQILPIAAAYDGMPCATRTPNKRMIL